MKGNEKEIFIGELVHHTGSTQATKPKRTKRLARIIGAGGGLTGLAKGLIVMTVTAALISTIVGNFIVSQTDNITLEGRLAYDLYVDGVPVGADDFVMPPDVFTDDKLVFGEVETFTHTFMSPALNGNFDIYWNQSWQTWLQPGHEADEFYGYTFSVENETAVPVSFITVMNGTTSTLSFIHALDYHFADTDNPLPYNFQMHVVEYKPAPTANPDAFSVAWRTATVIYPLVNDLPASGVTIMSVSGVPAGSSAVISPDGTNITYFQNSVNPETWSYTITTGGPLYKSSTATIITTIS